ncbi:MAG: hypothetical protein WC375_11045 [Methanomassiliicoccales archaeon]|jgi:hypothetical protein
MTEAKNIKIGLTGYSGAKFNEKIAAALVSSALSLVEEISFDENMDTPLSFTLVSGYTDLGIPAIGYRIAHRMGWETTGIACEKAKEYTTYPVDHAIIVGTEWGEESETFLGHIDMLVRVGGGKQAIKETEEAKKRGIKVLEFDLPEKPKK